MSVLYDDIPQGLHLLDLPQPRAGFSRFTSSWFFVDSAGRRVVVDPGPPSSAPILLEKLSSITDGVDVVLLTHIHIDHSGGVGQLCEKYGGAKVVVHDKAGRHLTNPEKLWKASLSTLGDVAVMYGEPKPLAPESLAGYDDFPGIEIMETPGHAPHHISFIVPFNGRRLFFVGESAGIRLPKEFGTRYLHPTTPPKFDFPAACESLAKMKSALRGDELLCYGHFGAESDSAAQITSVRKQLDEWLDVVSRMKKNPVGEIVDYLISNDPLLAGYPALPEDVRSRERFFLETDIKGLLEYLQDSKS
jgi:glyoxylase-like metal-dependent hydrolase (beta-lactamase superfamily II)